MARAKRQLSETELEEAKRVKASSPDAEPLNTENSVAADLSEEQDSQADASLPVENPTQDDSQDSVVTSNVDIKQSESQAAEEVDAQIVDKPDKTDDSAEKDESSQDDQKQAAEPEKLSAGKATDKSAPVSEPEREAKSSVVSLKSSDPSGSTAKDNDKPEASSKPKMTVFGSFGSKFSFGSANTHRNSLFGAGSSNPWAEPAKATTSEAKEAVEPKSPEKDGGDVSSADVSTSTAPVAGTEIGPDRFAKVKLEPQSVKTGEEDEEELFSSRAALYALNLQKTSEGWKNRGTGTLHLNRIPNTDKVRVVMRADGLLRVILNVPILLQSEVSRGFQSSSASEKFVRFHGVEENFPHQYAVRMQSKDQADAFYSSLTQVVDSIV